MPDLLRALLAFLLGTALILFVQRLMLVRRLRRQATSVDEGFGMSSLSLPIGWSAARELNSGANLQVIDPIRLRFAIVFTDLRADFTDMTLEAHSQSTREGLASRNRVLAVRGPWRRLVDGRDAIQFELDAIHENTWITYLHTTVAGTEAFHQVLAWSTSARNSRPAFERLLDGFHEIAGAQGATAVRRGNQPVQIEPRSDYTVH